MDFQLSDEQEAVRAMARQFAEREIAPYAREWDRDERMDRSIVKKLGTVGFLGASIPEEYGGTGLDSLSYCLVVE